MFIDSLNNLYESFISRNKIKYDILPTELRTRLDLINALIEMSDEIVGVSNIELELSNFQEIYKFAMQPSISNRYYFIYINILSADATNTKVGIGIADIMNYKHIFFEDAFESEIPIDMQKYITDAFMLGYIACELSCYARVRSKSFYTRVENVKELLLIMGANHYPLTYEEEEDSSR